MNKKITKILAGGLIITTINANICIDVEACDAAAVMEVAQQVSVGAGPIAPVIIGGALIITGITTVIGIKEKSKKVEIYQSLEYLPDTWKPDSIVERVKENGKIIQRRFYGKDGKPVLDIDLTNHGTPQYHPFTHGGVHKHTFDYSKRKARSRGQELSEEEYRKYVKEFDSKKAERITVHTSDE